MINVAAKEVSRFCLGSDVVVSMTKFVVDWDFWRKDFVVQYEKSANNQANDLARVLLDEEEQYKGGIVPPYQRTNITVDFVAINSRNERACVEVRSNNVSPSGLILQDQIDLLYIGESVDDLKPTSLVRSVGRGPFRRETKKWNEGSTAVVPFEMGLGLRQLEHYLQTAGYKYGSSDILSEGKKHLAIFASGHNNFF